jgi:hypothetical protein
MTITTAHPKNRSHRMPLEPALATGLLVLALAALTALADDPPPFKITAKRDDDRVDVKAEKDKVILSVQSPFGISQAVIERAGEKWPDAVVLRLHLKGLENFKVTNGKVKLEASASLQDGKPVMRLWQDGKEDAPLDAKSPFWIDVRSVRGELVRRPEEIDRSGPRQINPFRIG